MRIEVLNGWVEIKPFDAVTKAEQRLVSHVEQRVLGAAAKLKGVDGFAALEKMTDDELDFFEEVALMIFKVMVTAWSFGETISKEALDALPAVTADAIIEAVANEFAKINPPKVDELDPKAAPVESNASGSTSTDTEN